MTRLVVSVPTVALAADLADLSADVEVIVWPMDAPSPRPEIDLVVPPYMSQLRAIAHLEGVRTSLVQSQSIGYDGVAAALPAGIRFANAASVHETSTAELAVALMLAAQRELPRFVREQGEGRWAQQPTASLADRRVLLVGFGGVGTAIARRLAPFEVELTALARTAREEDGVRVHAFGDLADLLPDAEIVVLSLPGGDETRHVLDARTLALLPDGALVVNVGRGPLVDTDALLAELTSGRLRAALDVVDPEPLPAGHPLWNAPSLLLTPHVGGASSAMRPRMLHLLRTQIERLLAGEPPLNVVLP